MADQNERRQTETGPTGAAGGGGVSAKAMLATVALTALVGFAAVYAWLAPSDNGGGADRAPETVTAASTQAVTPTVAASKDAGGAAKEAGGGTKLPSGAGANPLSTGEVAGFVFKASPEPVPEVSFVDGEGKARTLADWKGRTVLLNLWATWCGPCRKEMPALDRLQAALGSDRFEVVALAIDRGGAAKVGAFLKEVKADTLKLYVDPTGKLTSPFKVIGLPTTLLIKDGKEVGRLVGPAEWDAREAQKLIQAVMAL